jgi:hypothetical protein
MTQSMRQPRQPRESGSDRATYRISVRGQLDDAWSQWFDDMTVAYESAGDGTRITVLTGAVADQPKLRGILARMWDLNLTVLSVERIAHGDNPTQIVTHSPTGGEQWENS